MKYPKHMEKQHSLTGEKLKYRFTEYKTKSKEYSIKILEKQQTESERQDEGAKPNSSEEVAKVWHSHWEELFNIWASRLSD